MNFSDNYPVWSTGENTFNMNNKVSQYEDIFGKKDQNWNHALNASQVPAWGENDSSWIQNDMCKNAMDTDSTNSADSQEAIPTWNKFEESHEATPAWASNHGESHEATPAWASNPGEWDQDSATRLAEKLLQVQIEATPSCFSSVGDTNRESQVNSPLMSQQDGAAQFISPNPRFKTEFCRNFREKGECIYGNQCQFAHGKAEIRHDMARHNKYKTKLCQKYWIKGWCAYGTRCNFIHQEQECNQAEKTRLAVCQPGFRPLLPAKPIRKSSESSADSGVEVNQQYYNSQLMNRAPGMEKVSSNKAKIEFNPEFCHMSMNFKNEVNSLYQQQHTSGSQWNDLKVKVIAEKENDMLNMNLASELNRNLYLDVVKVKENRAVPHPEDNPISASLSLPFNQPINSQYRMMKSATNTWPF